MTTSGSEYRGPTAIIRAAKDPVQVPTEPAIQEALTRGLCRAKIGEDCYVITGMTGDTRKVPYGGSLEQWQRACDELLELALREP